VPEELYDYEVDPCALNNLIDDPQHEQLVQQYRAEMLAKMTAIDDPLTEQYSDLVAGPGDFDLDNDVDQEDFGRFQECISGSGTLYEPGCLRADFDKDNDVDLEDFVKFQACVTGPNVQLDKNCINQ